MVLGKNGEWDWAGVDDKIIYDFLMGITENAEYSLDKLDKFTSLQEHELKRIIKFINNETIINNIDGKLTLNFNRTRLRDYYSEVVKTIIEKEMENSSGKYFVTPNLKNVNFWLNIQEKDFTSNIEGLAIALSLAIEEWDESDLLNNIDKDANHFKIVIDDKGAHGLANRLGEWIGIKNSIVNLAGQIYKKKPSRLRTFEKTDRVIVFTTLILTRDTVNRVVKSILRDGATCELIACIAKTEDVLNIKIWNKVIDIVALCKHPVNSKINKSLNKQYLQPYSFLPEDEKEEEEKSEEELFAIINKSKALHFNHIGEMNGRHFTFYLNPEQLYLNCKEKIKNKLISTIDNWAREFKVKESDIWFPSAVIEKGHPMQSLANDIKNHYKKEEKKEESLKIKGTVEIARSTILGKWSFHKSSKIDNSVKNLIILDWGSINGDTIEQLITTGAKDIKANILVCSIFSQLSPEEIFFYTSIKRLNNEFITHTVVEKDIYDNPTKIKTNKNIIDSRITIKFLYELPKLLTAQ